MNILNLISCLVSLFCSPFIEQHFCYNEVIWDIPSGLGMCSYSSMVMMRVNCTCKNLQMFSKYFVQYTVHTSRAVHTCGQGATVYGLHMLSNDFKL